MPTLPPGPTHNPAFFLISVSTRENLDLCVKYGLAGFPSGESGAWTFCEIQIGDFVSFLYGAKAHNLYQVIRRETLKGAELLPPWKLLTFTETGKTYSFPFRLHLEPVRMFTEPLVRAEFSYVAENLLLRGGYRKTHFQADQTTLQSVSGMGIRAIGPLTALSLPAHDTFELRFTRNKSLVKTPEICRFQETILQSAIRRHLTVQENLHNLLTRVDSVGVQASGLEVLGEKAVPQGHIDLLLKDRIPLGSAQKIPIEVKTKRAQQDDLSQLRAYMDEFGDECQMGLLIAADFNQKTTTQAEKMGIKTVKYQLSPNLDEAPTFEGIYSGLTLEPQGK